MLDPVAQVSQHTLIHIQGYSAELHEMPLLALAFKKTKYYSLRSPVIEQAKGPQCKNAGIYLMSIVYLYVYLSDFGVQ